MNTLIFSIGGPHPLSIPENGEYYLASPMAQILPKKLKKDSIVEALLEVQFESSELPELSIGRLAAYPAWATYPALSLPAANIPAPIRRAEPNMARLPILEKRMDGNSEFGRIGDHTISLHRQRPYSGWPDFGPKAHELVHFIYSAGLPDLKITRLGLRYVNAFTEAEHGITSLNQLRLTLAVGDEKVQNRAMLYFERRLHENLIAQVRISSKELIKNPLPPDLTVLVDVDMILPPEVGGVDEDQAQKWVESAHDEEKNQYFSLYTDEMLKRLVET